jgi:ribonuclease J
MLAFSTDSAEVTNTIKLNNVMVDGLGIGDVGQIVLRDRQQMADEGVVIIVVPVQQQTGQVGGEIEIITRGFVYVKESQELISKIKERAVSCLKPQEQVVTNWQRLRKKIELSVEKLLYEETERQPLILTVVLEV